MRYSKYNKVYVLYVHVCKVSCLSMTGQGFACNTVKNVKCNLDPFSPNNNKHLISPYIIKHTVYGNITNDHER